MSDGDEDVEIDQVIGEFEQVDVIGQEENIKVEQKQIE